MLMKTKKAKQYGDFTYCCGCGNKDRENRDENHTCTQIYCVCEYCSYATRKKHHMVTHMHSEKHRKNTDNTKFSPMRIFRANEDFFWGVLKWCNSTKNVFFSLIPACICIRKSKISYT